MQNTNKILMIRPVGFTYNPETAGNNLFQVAGNANNAQEKALKEFDTFVETLRKNDIDVTVINDTPEPHTPDSIFPNNWISFHENNTAILYPMYAQNRRAERKQHVKDFISQNFNKGNIVDLTSFEKDNIFLEGTGSMVLDRENKIAYACISPRTNKKVLDFFCYKMNYTACTFEANDESGNQIYHTNVMMCVANRFIVICLDSITNEEEKKKVIKTIEQTSKKIISISYKQMNSFAGNMLQLKDSKGEKLLVMSAQAFQSLSKEQIVMLSKYNRIIYSNIETIEKNGGGSARCMIAEVF
ncbi:MAG TPA: arginine deiminase-related protein [Parafilimonas sp.]|nr:arginine deiminase-related protein [Parafilimonas sp.]